MSFLASFIASRHPQGPPVAAKCYVPAPPAGTYNSGLITVLEPSLSNSLASHWYWLFGADILSLAYTAFGDLIVMSTTHRSVFFVEVRQGIVSKVDVHVAPVFEEFLPSPAAREHVLREREVLEVSKQLGPLNYGECYVAGRWRNSGGTGVASTFKIMGVLDYNKSCSFVAREKFDPQYVPQYGIQADTGVDVLSFSEILQPGRAQP